MENILATALGQDVSKLAAQEKQLLLSRLLARLAHEIRNPLSSLDIHVQLLEEDLAQGPAQVREKAAGRFEIIRGELHRLENIVKQFLSLAGPSALDLQPVEPARLIQSRLRIAASGSRRARHRDRHAGAGIVARADRRSGPAHAGPGQPGHQCHSGGGRPGQVAVRARVDAGHDVLAIEVRTAAREFRWKNSPPFSSCSSRPSRKAAAWGFGLFSKLSSPTAARSSSPTCPRAGRSLPCELPLRPKPTADG